MELVKEIGENKFKLSLSSENKMSLEHVLTTHREYEEFDISLEMKGEKDIQLLKNLYRLHGAKAIKLSWSNWSHQILPSSDVVEMLNYFPNLKFLKLSSEYAEFTGETVVGSLHLPHLVTLEISECHNFILDFLSQALHENVLKSLRVDNASDVDAKFSSLIAKQSSIKELNIRGDYMTVEHLKHLELEYLRCILYKKEGKVEQQRKFLKSFIKSQSELRELDLLNDSDYSFSIVDDEIFDSICGLHHLEKLLISIDEMTPEGVKYFRDLHSLKSLELKTNREISLDVFKELSEQKNSSLEELILNTWNFDIPAETYEAFGRNYENLKSLIITLGTRHSINFYARAFPNLECLSVKFGETNNPMEFSQAYDPSDKVTHTTLKKVKLIFWGIEIIDVKAFTDMLQIFTNLEVFQIHTKFAFSANVINHIANHLHTIKALKLTTFEIHNNETYSNETIDALKLLRTKVDFISLGLSNIQHTRLRHGHGMTHEGDDLEPNFNFRTLIKSIRNIYDNKPSGYENSCIHNSLELTSGGCEHDYHFEIF